MQHTFQAPESPSWAFLFLCSRRWGTRPTAHWLTSSAHSGGSRETGAVNEALAQHYLSRGARESRGLAGSALI
jgi:hypothetical protein